MIRTLLAALLLLTACAGPEPASPQKTRALPSTPAEESPTAAPDPTPDPLMAAMALLKAAKDDPQDTAAARRAAEAFLALERGARERGETEAAARYQAVAAELDPFAALPADEEPDAPPEGPLIETVTVQVAPAAAGQAAGPEEPLPMDGLRLGTHHFSVKISGTRAARSAEAVVGVLEEAYLKVCGAMAVNPDGKVPVVLYTDREFHAETGLPSWVGGAYNGTIHLPMAGLDVSRPSARNVIVHEFVHAFNHQVAKGRCPLWLEEGLAQYFEDPRPPLDTKALAAAARGGGLPSLTSPSFLSGGQGQAATLYQMAQAAVLYLEDRASLAAVSSFLQALGSGTPAPQAFQETFLFPYDRLQGDLLQWLEKRNR